MSARSVSSTSSLSTLSPLELGRARARGVPQLHHRRLHQGPARHSHAGQDRLQRGCELALFLPSKVGNLDCTFCLDCVQACPHDNVAIGFRVPGEELTDDRLRSVDRPALATTGSGGARVLFTFGALLNAFAMVGPVYSTEQWIARLLHTTSEAPVLGLIFVAGLVLLPLALCGGRRPRHAAAHARRR